MRIDAEIQEKHRFCDPDFDQFVDELESAGIPLEIGDVRMKPPIPGYGISGPESLITITIDPDSLRLLFEYTAALITIYKSTDYVGYFFKKVLGSLAVTAGAKIAAILSHLWRNLYRRIRSKVAEQKLPKMRLDLEFLIEGLPVLVYMPILPGKVKEVSEKDEEQALGLLFYKVLPLLPEAIFQARAAGDNPERVGVTLALPESLLESYAGPEVAWRRGAWHWLVYISPRRQFIIDRHGERKDRNME
jgi:hypothetical protein